MSCQKFSRQYLHMVFRTGRGLYSLEDMDVSRLFYPSREEAKAATKENNCSALAGRIKKNIGSLPERSRQYKPQSTAVSPLFALLGKDKILCSDADGFTSVYNTECDSFLGMPRLNWPKGPKHISIPVKRSVAHAGSDFELRPDLDSELFAYGRQGDQVDSLYILDMDQNNPCSFEALAYYPVSRWCWKRLPTPSFGKPLDETPDNIPFTVVGGTKICVSFGPTTYTFDTVAICWNKVGDWVLPFHSKAEYDAQLGMWFGLSPHSPHGLCALDLSCVANGFCDTPPTVQCIGLDVDPPENWLLKNAALVNMGLGRFCIAKFFDCVNERDNPRVVVLTGVEVVPPNDHGGEQGFCMFRHRSECLASDSIVCVL